ncbi:response regulator [Sulfitobacter sp. S0837]|uniref:response regulator n=1 Tax=Sulfitobacter maritimus TaxID=2741719 RepID=UPI00158338D4|nr:response regulator [Sulfitobacter maritimus]
MKILAVDDDPIVLDLIGTTMAKTGSCEVTTASSGAEALKLLSTQPAAFDCLVLDIEMPLMNGIDLCKEIRALPKYTHTPILMLTQRTDARSVGRAFVAGATDYVTKPFKPRDLVARLRVAQRVMNTTTDVPRISAQDMQKHGIPGTHCFEEEEPFYIADTPRLVLPFSLGTYLSQQSRGHLDQCYIFAATLNSFEKMYNQCSTRELCIALTTATKAIARSLNQPDLLMSHNGSGTLLCVFTTHQMPNWPAVESSLPKELWNLAPRHANGARIKMSLSLGKPIQPNASPTQRVRKTFDRAIQRVERQRSERRALKAASPPTLRRESVDA